MATVQEIETLVNIVHKEYCEKFGIEARKVPKLKLSHLKYYKNKIDELSEPLDFKT